MPETAPANLQPPPLAGIADELGLVEAWIEAQLRPDQERMEPLLAHLGRFRGKRVRASQVLLVGQACGRLTEEHRIVAGIIELIHTATLVHDDLLDEATQRRGISCMHVEWGSHAAVLLGDWIYARAFMRSTEIKDRECSRVLARATRRVCSGEIRQNLTRGDFHLSEAEYLEEIDAKTAALYEAGGRLAAHYAGAGPALQEACARHGLLAGRAFQVADDLLDMVGEEERMGKSLGTDLARGKMTLPLIRLRDRLAPPERVRLEELFGSRPARESLQQGFLAGAWEDALASCRSEVRSLLLQACQALEPLPEGPSRTALVDLTEFLGTRRR